MKFKMRRGIIITFLLILFLPSFVSAASGHGADIQPLLISMSLVILAGRIGGDIAVRLKQPEVLGELIIGVLLGNLVHFGLRELDQMVHLPTLELLAELGVIILLFEVGLETNLKEMLNVGLSSLLVAILGVVVPFGLGWGVSAMFLPEAGGYVHAFIGATLCATSVGITARVLKEIGKLDRKESKIILGAAVIDDVLGLLILAVVSGVIQSANSGADFNYQGLIQITLIALGFLGIAVFFGSLFSPLFFKGMEFFKSHGLLLIGSLLVCFSFSYLAAVAGLAPIIGAFTAGLVLEPSHYEGLAKKEDANSIEDLIHPIGTLLIPVFFVEMGAKVNILDFISAEVITFALVLSVAAMIGKQACSFGVLGRGIDKIAVGLGMIPRGEVGLIFAGIGLGLSVAGEPVISSSTYGAVVFMVILTTMVTPPLVKWRFSKIKDNPIKHI